MLISCLSMAFFQFLKPVLLWWRPGLCYSHCWCLRFEFIYIIKAKNQSQGKSQYHLSWNCRVLFVSLCSTANFQGGLIWFKINLLIVRVAVSHCWSLPVLQSLSLLVSFGAEYIFLFVSVFHSSLLSIPLQVSISTSFQGFLSLLLSLAALLLLLSLGVLSSSGKFLFLSLPGHFFANYFTSIPKLFLIIVLRGQKPEI